MMGMPYKMFDWYENEKIHNCWLFCVMSLYVNIIVFYTYIQYCLEKTNDDDSVLERQESFKSWGDERQQSCWSLKLWAPNKSNENEWFKSVLYGSSTSSVGSNICWHKMIIVYAVLIFNFFSTNMRIIPYSDK